MSTSVCLLSGYLLGVLRGWVGTQFCRSRYYGQSLVRKIDNVLHSPDERLVLVPDVGGKNGDARMLVDALQQVIDLEVLVAVLRILDV